MTTVPTSGPERVPQGWRYRGYLPHLDAGGVTQVVTFHLGDAIPERVVSAWREELHGLGNEPRATELRRRLDRYGDEGHGACWLARPAVAMVVERALTHFDGVRYRLLEWVVMPNHVHVLLHLHEGVSLSTVMHSLKSFTAHEANALLHRTGQFWDAEYFDRFVRDEQHLLQAARYIRENPVKGGLCAAAEDWRFGSAWRAKNDALPPGRRTKS